LAFSIESTEKMATYKYIYPKFIAHRTEASNLTKKHQIESFSDITTSQNKACYLTHSYEYVNQYLNVIFTDLYLHSIVGNCAAAILFFTVD
jgi:hypothetical protein